jgi:hypothetical protein
MRYLSKLALLFSPLFISACGKPFPFEDALYDEYKTIVCAAMAGNGNIEMLNRQLELNKIFDDGLAAYGTPTAKLVKKHSEKLVEAMRTDNCETAVKTTIKAPSNNAPITASLPSANPLAKFDSIWHFNAEKTLAANKSDNEIDNAILDGTVMGLSIRYSNSAGIRIQNGIVQDADDRCTLEASSSQAQGTVNCVNQRDRTISGTFDLSDDGDLIVTDFMGVNRIYEKR